MPDIIVVAHSTYTPMIESLYSFPGNRRELKAQKYNLCEYTRMSALLSSSEPFELMSAELPHPITWAKLSLYLSALLLGSSGRQMGLINCNENQCYSTAQEVSKLQVQGTLRKDCFQIKSKFISAIDLQNTWKLQFLKKIKWSYLQKIIKTK